MVRRIKENSESQSSSTDVATGATASTISSEHSLVTVRCPQLRQDDDGGLIEAPSVLKQVETLRKQIGRFLKKKRAEVHSIVAHAGRYEFKVSPDSAQCDLFSGRSILDLIVPPLAHAVQIIKDNARCSTPKTGAELGISAEILQIEHTLAELLCCGLAATIQRSGEEDATELPAVEKDELSSIALETRDRQWIDCLITGVGLEPDGIRIEVNRGARLAIVGMTLEMTIPYLQRVTHVSGNVVYEGDRAILENYAFEDCPESGSLGF